MSERWISERPVPLDYGGPVDVPFEPFGSEWFDRSPIARFDHIAATFPDRLAVDDGTRRMTYAEVRRAAIACAHVLAEQAPPGRPIAAVFRYTALFPVALLASIAAARPLVPIDIAYPIARQRMILDNAGADCLLTEAGVPLDLALPDLPRIEISLEGLAARQDEAWPDIAYDRHAMGGVTFTSGSTGSPKGLVWSFGGFMPTVAETANTHHLNERDKIIALGSLASAGLGDALFALLSGASLRIVDMMGAGMGEVMRILGEERVTILAFVPAVLRSVLAMEGAERAFRHLRILDLYGDATLAADIDVFRTKLPADCHIRVVLGSIEAGPIFHWFVRRDFASDGLMLPCGYLGAHKQMAVLGPNGEAMPVGTEGELAVRSRYMALGSWQNGRITQGPFLPDPDDAESRIYPMGDIVRVRPDGLCEFLGRRDRMVKIRGLRADLGEVEAALRQHRQVADVAVVTIPDDDDTIMIAYIVARDADAPPPLAELRRLVADQTAEHMIPARFHILPEIPRLPNYKPDLVRLTALARGEAVPAAEPVPAAVASPSGLGRLTRTVRRLVGSR